MRREVYWRPAKETEANVNSSEYVLFTQSHAWSVKIVLWSVKSQGIFVILMGGNPVFDWEGQASLSNYFQSCQWSGTLYFNMIIS